MAELSQQQLASALGINPGAVSKLKRRGMPVHSVEAARQWRREHVRARISASGQGGGGDGRSADAPPLSPQGLSQQDSDYWVNRARREKAEADLAELKLAEQRGELVRAEAVRASVARTMTGLREALLQIPARLAAVLAAEDDQRKVHDVLERELHAALLGTQEGSDGRP